MNRNCFIQLTRPDGKVIHINRFRIIAIGVGKTGSEIIADERPGEMFPVQETPETVLSLIEMKHNEAREGLLVPDDES